MPRRYYKKADRRQFYAEALQSQNGCCALCGSKSRLVINKDRHTGYMRGLLCFTHNMALGMFKDSPTLLEKAATYIQEHNAEEERNLHLQRYGTGTAAKTEGEIVTLLLQDTELRSRRAKARVLAERTGLLLSTAYTKLRRAELKQHTLLETVTSVNGTLTDATSAL